MTIHSIDSVSFADTRVLCRVDYNVPLKDGKVADGFRIVASLPTLKKILGDGGSLILMSHLGRPKGGPSDEFRMAPVAARLAELLQRPVAALRDCVGDDIKAACANMKPGDVVLLENLRFHAEEQKTNADFGRQLAELATAGGSKGAYVSDAFGTAHRPDTSMVEPPKHLPAFAGYLMMAEEQYLGGIVRDPQRPLVAVLGGAKVSDKILILENLSKRTDAICIGGAMAYTFLKAQGQPIGKSLCEADRLDTARAIIDDCAKRNVKLCLPVDHVVAASIDASAGEVAQSIADDKAGFDIGPATRAVFATEIANAKMVLFNGPVGVFEKAPFAEGTKAVCDALAATSATTIVGGGDAASAVATFGVKDKLTHVSTGGGASLEYLEGKTLPGLAALDR